MPTRSKFTIGFVATLSLALFACDGGESAVDALKRADEEPKVDSKKIDEGEKREIPTAEMPEPTAEELAAWDRKDPEGEKHLYKWDKAHAKTMQIYWKELRCLRQKVKEQGQLAFGTEPGGPEQEKWEQFKQAFNAMVVDPWQQRLFAAEGTDILSKSKVIGNILEAHELVMKHYPTAYNDGDEKQIKIQDARWTVVENKVVDYYDKIGAPMTLPDLEDPKQAKAWEKFCAPVVLPAKKKKVKAR
jgi:hypothetical protein